MTDRKKSDLEAIAAFKQQARSHRLSSTLRSEPRSVSSVQEAHVSYGATYTTEGVSVSKDGRVTVTIEGCLPLSPGKIAQIVGRSRVSIPEYKSSKESVIKQENDVSPESSRRRLRKPSL